MKLTPSTSNYVPVSLQKVGLNAISALPTSKRDELLRFTPVDGKRATIIYAEDVVSVIGRHIPPRPPVKKMVMKKAAKKAAHSGRFGPRKPSVAADRQKVAYKAIRAVGSDQTREPTTASINKFIALFFDEIRIIICTKKMGTKGKVGEASTVTAVAAMILKYFAITAAAAHAIATAIIYTIYTAAKNAFCKMGAVDAKALVLDGSPKRKK